jgi:L-idonate 5-dehydrogenase
MQGVFIKAARDLVIEDIPAVAVGARDVAIAVTRAGICGSDLHYFLHGGFGAIRLREPLILGHEIAGVVTEAGREVSGVAVGTRVAVNPTTPCGHCKYCREGLRRHCLEVRFLGSAMRFPHVQGGFREVLTTRAENIFPLAPDLTFEEAAMAEPLAVCLHACARAGSLLGKRVLVTGSGPIGALCVLVARHAGALEIVATDVNPFALGFAARMGAHETIDTSDAGALDRFTSEKGHFDVLIEASGNEKAIRQGLECVRPCGVFVQVGLGGDISVPLSTLVSREIEIRGTFRFDAEFKMAVDILNSGALDLKPLHTHTFPHRSVMEAFEKAADKSSSMKVQLSFA